MALSPTSSHGSSSSSGTAGTEIGYDQITSNVAIASTTEATGTTVIACAAHTFDGSPVLATFFTPLAATLATGGLQIVICLFEGATEIGRIANWQTPSGTSANAISLTGSLRFTPSAASHTYTVTAFMTASTGTVTAGLGGTGVNVAAFIRFTKV